jgi:SP family general alpha glucoside:H+ symporter-like MFS transporter
MATEKRSSLVSPTHGYDETIDPHKGSVRRLSISHANTVAMQADAKAAFDTEKTMSVRQAIPLYKKAILFSMAMSLAVVMEG